MKGRERSTATGRRVDLSAPRRASAAPANPNGEDLLFRGYGDIGPGERGLFRVTNRREERCACGGNLVDSGTEPISKIVKRHNETELHKAWRTWRETA